MINPPQPNFLKKLFLWARKNWYWALALLIAYIIQSLFFSEGNDTQYQPHLPLENKTQHLQEIESQSLYFQDMTHVDHSLKDLSQTDTPPEEEEFAQQEQSQGGPALVDFLFAKPEEKVKKATNNLDKLLKREIEHQKLLQTVAKNPTDPDTLYKLIVETYNLGEYEEALDLGEKLLELTPNDMNFRKTLQIIRKEDQNNKAVAKRLEVDLFREELSPELKSYFEKSVNSQLGGDSVSIIRWAKINMLTEGLELYKSRRLEKVMFDLKALKMDPNYSVVAQQFQRLFGIETGQIEGLYDVSVDGKRLLMQKGIDREIIFKDETDKIMNGLSAELKKERAEAIVKMINDNISVFKMLDSFVDRKEKLSIEMIKELHLLFTQWARYVSQESELELIRRGKWKLFTNYVIGRNLTGSLEQIIVQIFAPPSRVDECMQDMIEMFYKLEEKKVAPQVLAAWLHVTFIYIHPFDDGNGRVARAITSLVLLQNNLLPFNIGPERKIGYIEALQKAREGNISSFVQLIEDQQERLYLAFKQNIERV